MYKYTKEEDCFMMHPVGDAVAIITTITTVLGLLPGVAALFAIVWYIFRFYEKFTGKTIGKSKIKD